MTPSHAPLASLSGSTAHTAASTHLPLHRARATDLDLELVFEALHGDPSARARLCTWYHPQICAISGQVLARRPVAIDARDLVQEVWARLLEDDCRRLRWFRSERGPFGPFLRLVTWQQATYVARVWADRRHRHQRFAPVAAPLPAAASPGLDRVEARRDLRRLVDLVDPGLDSLDQTLLEHLAIGRTSVRELASSLGHSPSMLYKRRQRLRTRLQEAARRLQTRDGRWAAQAREPARTGAHPP